MAHYISYGSLDLRFPTWITLEILELIHADAAPTLWEGAFLLDQNQSEFRLRPLVNLNNFEQIAPVLYWRQLFQMSALSTRW